VVAAYCYARSIVVGVSVFWSRSRALQKWLNWLTSCLGGWVGWTRGTIYEMGVQIPQRDGAILGVVHPTEKYWEPLKWCTQKRLNRLRCCLGVDSCGPKKPFIRWCEGWKNPIATTRGDKMARRLFVKTLWPLVYYAVSWFWLVGDLVGEDNVNSSPTFELIVKDEEAEEVELESCGTTTGMTSSDSAAAAMTTVAMTTYANKRLRMSDASAAVNIASLSDCVTASGFGTGLSQFLM